MSKQMIQFVTLAVALITTREQSRKQAVSEAEEVQLLESVKSLGIMSPIGVRAEGEKYAVVFGHRRLKAARAAGLTEVPVAVLDGSMTESDFLAIQLQENIQRVDISQYDLWQGAVRLMESSPGMSQADLGRRLSLTPPNVTKMLSASKVTPEWVRALQEGRVSLGDTYTASRLKLEEQNALLALRLNGATRDQIVAAEKKSRAPTAVDAIKLELVKLPLTSALSITVKGPSMTLSQLVDALTQAREAAQKSLKESLDIKTAMKVWADKAKASA